MSSTEAGIGPWVRLVSPLVNISGIGYHINPDATLTAARRLALALTAALKLALATGYILSRAA